MNGRILELAKNPDQFQIKDLELLSSEINKHPYIQSLRALHLLGTHRLQPENYSNELSITAAYTTDKKILYQLINAVTETKPSVESISEPIIQKETETDPKNKFTEIESKVTETPKAVYVNGELNRILFEGEEDFLDRETETIDLESSLEAGQIVTNPAEKQEFSEVSDTETFSTETIIKEEIISEEKAIIENSSELSFHETAEFLPDAKVEPKTITKEVQESEESSDSESFSKEIIVEEDLILQEKPGVEDASTLSFHATDDFLPDVKIASNQEKAEIQQMAKPALNKHEEEMKRLIAEVEEKMKASKKQKVSSQTKDESSESAEVNFSETQSFEIEKTEESDSEESEKEKSAAIENTQKTEPLIKEKTEIQPIEISPNIIEHESGSTQEDKPVWKPMSFSTNIPDALISKKTEEKSVEKEEIAFTETPPKTEEKTETIIDENATAERPVFNVSFFTQNVSALEKANREEEKPTEILEDSNVPDFINTWQSWLKIDRIKQEAKEKIEISITEIKNKVIENFIEKEPRISKLKEESDFVIKERNDDISHLMTETLANLYTEQKLYTKAIKAFGILSEKHPDKKPHFDDKIKQIKELRQNK
ncbi:hypothetical protein QGN23_09450 [Chryseobacterium gotjawalense]|uniref:Tetratricopeptide repeat protein n=1 Tax=Chryseobacterium gotjawalense TaxID=3042315 RepID=A0ABY8RBT8_9FLAO|nr:hypothetical protein [Chryseobacterium sp. wdc7]WHF50663.1 hypothetical protein QGN23_09450 [Chryseobacterium sp. wdc7]